MIPGITTYLRAIEEKDLELIREWNFDPEIRKSFPSSFPVSMGEQKKWYERQMASSDKKKLVICDKETNDPIGLISAMYIDHFNRNCEVGWTIGNKKYWGKGAAVDAIFTFCDFLFDQYNMHMLYGYVLGSNERALHFDEHKIGFIISGSYKEAIYKDGKYWDNVVVCLFRESFYAKYDAYKAKMGVV